MKTKDKKWYNELVEKRGESKRIFLPLGKKYKTKTGKKKENERR